MVFLDKMKVLDNFDKETIYDIQLDYVGNNAFKTWKNSPGVYKDQREIIRDILRRPQDIIKSNIFERRFLIKKVFATNQVSR